MDLTELTPPALPDLETSPPLRWGVVGTGGIAASFTRDTAQLPGGGRVVAVASRDAGRGGTFADQHAIGTVHVGAAELASDPQVDVVYVASPHPWHAEHALAAIAAGKHVLVEKPFTMNGQEARDVASAAGAAGVFAMEAMWTRFLPHIHQLRAWVDSGAIGTVRTVMADHGQWFAFDPRHRLFAPDLGGGALLDLGIYPLSFASMLLGTPSAVSATADPTQTGVDAQTSILLQHNGGAHAVLSCTLESATPCQAFVSGTEGRVTIDRTFYAPTTMRLTRRDGQSLDYDGTGVVRPGGKGLRLQAAELERCVAAGLTESPLLTLAESVSVMETVDRVVQQTGF